MVAIRWSREIDGETGGGKCAALYILAGHCDAKDDTIYAYPLCLMGDVTGSWQSKHPRILTS